MPVKQGARYNLQTIDPLGAAATTISVPITGMDWVKSISLEAQFVRVAGGTTLKSYVQTSLDNGVTWFDIACFAFTTTSANKLHAVRTDPATPLTPATAPGDGALTDDTVLNGILGAQYRVKTVSVGTYTGASSFRVDAVFRG